MKIQRSCFLLFLSLLTFAGARTWELGDWARVTAPESYEKGVPFTVEVELLQPEGSGKLSLSANALRKDGTFAGFLQFLGHQEVSGAGTYSFPVTIQREKPDLGLVTLTVYESPGGDWKDKTVSGMVPILPPGGSEAMFARSAEGVAGTVKRGEPAGAAKGGAAGGLEPYTPRDEYFTQREEAQDLRQWKLVPLNFPPLEEILAKPAQDRPVYGLYMWGGEYEKAHEEVEEIGIRSVRFSGPWDESHEALKIAAEKDVEVLYTVTNGDRLENRKMGRRPAFDSDEAFVADYEDALAEFIGKFGPDGSLYEGTGLESPIAVFEILNEPNYQYVIPDREPRAEVEREREAIYGALLPRAYPVAKDLAPSIPVAGFSCGGGGATAADYRFVKNIYENVPGIHDDYDIFTTHPYMHGAPPEGAKIKPWGPTSMVNNLARMRELQAKYGPPKPVWYTEVGWEIPKEYGGQFDRPKPDTLVTPDIHAAYTVRLYLISMRLGVERVHVMHIHDTDGYNGAWMTRDGFEWRPVSYAVQHLIDRMPNPRMTGAQADGNDTFIYEYLADGQDPDSGTVIVAWNVSGPKVATVEVDAGTVTVYDMVGNEKSLPVADGKVEVEIGPYPVYLVPGG